jgi:adenosylcobinamide kinase/adenosylcobinamide-phosphate guanylyltransferase
MITETPYTRRVLVLGGARSGKSRIAQQMCENTKTRGVYIATAQAYDDEMRARIAQHQGDRDSFWSTFEAPFDLPQAVRSVTGEGHVVLVDCLTLWLSNVMLAEREVAAAIDALCSSIAAASGPVVLVSNEVGNGIVPDNALARRFRDAQGRLNQAVADVCDRVILVVAGCPLLVKPAPALDIALK